jgi:hypothetical protein
MTYVKRRWTATIRLLVASAFSILIALSVPVTGFAQQAATMSLTGSTSIGVGEIALVEVRVKTTTPVNAVQADFTFPTSLFAFDSIDGNNSAFPAGLISSSANGTVSIVRAVIGGGSGDMLVATVKLKGLKDGRGELKLLDSSMAPDAASSENIVSVRQGMTIQVGSPAADAPVEQGGSSGSALPNNQNGGSQTDGTDGNTTNPSATPTIDPDLDDGSDTGGSSLSGGSGTNTTSGNSKNSSSVSPVAWAIIVMSLLLVSASVFFSVNILKRRNRRAAAYQNYMQPPVNPMYSQGRVYDLNSIGYSRQYPTGGYQSASPQAQQTPRSPQGTQGNYGVQYPQYNAGNQYPTPQPNPQAPVRPTSQIYQPEQSFSPDQHNQSPW